MSTLSPKKAQCALHLDFFKPCGYYQITTNGAALWDSKLQLVTYDHIKLRWHELGSHDKCTFFGWDCEASNKHTRGCRVCIWEKKKWMYPVWL